MASSEPPSGSTSSYPIQSQDYTPVPQLSPMESDHAETVYPRSIRALRDSKAASDHCRTIVICLDGTGDQFDADNSNVVHFVSCLRKHTHSAQVTYYQSGIGTYDKGGIKNGLGAAADMAVGSGLGTHVKDAYRFLMQNYREGDKICLLGFSRGAYTVRCLAGMLHKVGLLPAGNGSQINFAYNFFKNDTPAGWKMSAEFKRTFCTSVSVYFIGVWDCVASVGFIPRKLPFSKSPTNSVRYFRHAMALDEHRSKFKACHWQNADPDLKHQDPVDRTLGARVEAKVKEGRWGWGCLGMGSGKGKAAGVGEEENANTQQANGTGRGDTDEHQNVMDKLIDKIDKKEDMEQDKLEAYFEALDASRKRHNKITPDVKEVWFMGGHADIGGGAVSNETRHKLSSIPLRWMIRQCFECNTGILFSTEALANTGLDMHNLWPAYVPVTPPSLEPAPSVVRSYREGTLPALNRRAALLRIGEHTRAVGEEEETDLSPLRSQHASALLPESTEDYFDSRAAINDQLKQARGWWVLEFWPVKVRVLGRDGQAWEKRVRLNMGRFRAVRESDPKYHWTVEHMVAEGKYRIRNRVREGTGWVGSC